jgi:hypothetical protein
MTNIEGAAARRNSNRGPDAPDVRATLTDARRCIALGKLIEFEFQACRLGDLVAIEILSTDDAVDFLYEAALANGLTGTHGEELIRDIVVRAVSGEYPQ